MVGIATVDPRPDEFRGQAELVLAIIAGLAITAADPRINHTSIADRDILGIGPDRDHRPDRLMSQRQRQFDTTIGEFGRRALNLWRLGS